MHSSELRAKSPKRLPVRFIVSTFLAVILTGTALLMMPFASKGGEFTPFIDALFTATSATCVTGLVVFDTYTKWSVSGQVIILALIQIGGLGLVTITTFFNMALGKKLGLRSMQLASESVSSANIGDTSKIVKMVMIIALSFELIGAAILCISFVPKYGREGIFISVFTAISAFCNAGFDILGREGKYVSLTNYTGDFIVMTVTMILIIAGGLGFVVWHNIFNYRKNKKLMLHSKIVLSVTAILIVLGFFIFAIGEWNNPATLGQLPFFERLGAALFQSVTTRTAGFNTVDFGEMNPMTKAFSVILMFIGAAPGSTGGGVKISTISIIFMTVVCVIRGREDTIILKRKVDKSTVYKSFAVMIIAILVVSISAAIMFASLQTSQPTSGVDTFFEATSAFATVGLSAGITGYANIPTKIVLILSMFIGRVGPVSFALAVAMRSNIDKDKVMPDAKILVG